MSESDFEYFERRASEERAAADRAAHWSARQSHLELALRYDEMVKATKIPADVIEFRSRTDA
jgi:hypothetical protein